MSIEVIKYWILRALMLADNPRDLTDMQLAEQAYLNFPFLPQAYIRQEIERRQREEVQGYSDDMLWRLRRTGNPVIQEELDRRGMGAV